MSSAENKNNNKTSPIVIIVMILGALLLGILLIVVVISLNNYSSQKEQLKVLTTKNNLKELHAAVNIFKLDTGRYPTDEEGLYALIKAPANVTGWTGYLETTVIPKDAWKNEMIYKLNPEIGRPFVIISYGADGKEGGGGYDMDLYSTDVD